MLYNKHDLEHDAQKHGFALPSYHEIMFLKLWNWEAWALQVTRHHENKWAPCCARWTHRFRACFPGFIIHTNFRYSQAGFCMLVINWVSLWASWVWSCPCGGESSEMLVRRTRAAVLENRQHYFISYSACFMGEDYQDRGVSIMDIEGLELFSQVYSWMLSAAEKAKWGKEGSPQPEQPCSTVCSKIVTEGPDGRELRKEWEDCPEKSYFDGQPLHILKEAQCCSVRTLHVLTPQHALG